MATSSPINPYESPCEATARAPSFSERDAAELAELRERVADLERRVARSWIVHPNIFLRIFGVWGYLVLGYALIVVPVFAVMSVIWLITGTWP